MKIKDAELLNRPHPEREFCSWNDCKDISEHHVFFKIRMKKKNNVTRWLERLMGLCDKHRGNFNRKFMGGKRMKKRRRK